MASNNSLVPEEELKAIAELAEKNKQLISTFKDLLNSSKDVFNEFQEGAKSLKQLNDSIEKSDQIYKKVNETYKEQKKVYEEKEKIQQKVVDATSEEVDAVRELNNQHTQTSHTLRLVSIKAYQEASKKINEQRLQYIKLQNELKAIQSAMKSLDTVYGNNKNSEKYLQEKVRLIDAEQNQKNAIKQLGDTIKYNNQIISTQIGSYDNLSAQYNRLKIVVNGLSDSETYNGKSKQELEDISKSLYVRMSELQKQTGKNILDVGQYDIAVKDLTQTLSILDPRIGTILTKAQSLSGVKEIWTSSNQALVKSLNITTKAATVLQFAVVGLIVGGVYLAIKAFKDWREEIQRAEQSERDFQNIFREGNRNAQSEIASLDVLYRATQNNTKSINERISAVNQLQKDYPDYFANLSQEEILNGKAEESYNKLSTAINNSAMARAANDKLVEVYRKKLDLELKLVDKEAELIQKTANTQTYSDFSRYLLVSSREDQLSTWASSGRETGIQKEIIKLQDEIKETETLIDRIIEKIDIQDLLTNPKGGGGNAVLDAELKALREIQALIIQEQINNQKTILSNNENAYTERLAALELFLESQQKKINQKRDDELADLRKNFKTESEFRQKARYQIELIELKSENEINAITQEGETLRQNIISQFRQEQIEVIKKYSLINQQNISGEYNLELALLSERYQKGILATEEYEKEKLAIQKRYRNDQFNEEISGLEKILDITDLSAKDRESIEQQLGKAKIDYNKYLNDTLIKQNEDAAKKTEEIERNLQKRRKELLKEGFDTASDFINTLYERQLNNLDLQQKADEDKYDKQLKDVDSQLNSQVITEEKAESRRRAIQTQREQREEEYQRKSQEIQRKQAIFQKSITATQILIDTAGAIVNQLKTTPLPLGAGFVAAISAIGAAQFATVLAQPIPQYEKGTKDHPGGFALIAEKRPEAVIEPSGKTWIADKPMIVDLQKHAQVIPNLNQMINMDSITDNKAPIIIQDNSKQISLLEKNNSLLKRSIDFSSRKVSSQGILNQRITINN